MSAISRATATDALAQRYRAVRAATLALAEPLSPEDCALQSMPDASPTKWHLAHTSWYFETFALEPALPGYRCFDPAFRVLFNSYYNGVGPQYARPQRGLLTPRARCRLSRARRSAPARAARRGAGRVDAEIIPLGTHHEQQHQERSSPGPPTCPRRIRRLRRCIASRRCGWIRSDTPAAFRRVPGRRARGATRLASRSTTRVRATAFPELFALASRPVTNREYVPSTRAATAIPSCGRRRLGQRCSGSREACSTGSARRHVVSFGCCGAREARSTSRSRTFVPRGRRAWGVR
jgi:hypothetical protein